MTIKAIETAYNGYRFRSRLEARWAVFFDALGVEYEYEPEGFDIDGTWYLPDFYLPDHEAWIEIKGKHVQLGEHREEYIHALVCMACLAVERGSQFATRTALVIFGGPYLGDYEIVGMRKGDEVGETLNGHFYVGRKNDLELWVGRDDLGISCLKTLVEWDDRHPMDVCERVQCAYQAARQARFEHGEQPVTAEMLEGVA